MFARTPRLLLRPGWPEDTDALHHAINDEAIVRNLASVPWPYSREDAEEFLSQSQDIQIPRWLIYRRTIGMPCLIGTCGLDWNQDDEVELGYWIGRDHWGLGYATEASRAVLETAKALGHREIVASHFIDNPASGKVLAKLGFRQTGRTLSRFSEARGASVRAVELRLTLENELYQDSNAESDDMRALAA